MSEYCPHCEITALCKTMIEQHEQSLEDILDGLCAALGEAVTLWVDGTASEKKLVTCVRVIQALNVAEQHFGEPSDAAASSSKPH